MALICGLMGVVALVGYLVFGRGWQVQNYLAITVFAYVCFLIAGARAIFGAEAFRQFTFPLCFLLFLVPFPIALTEGIETFFQHTTAAVAHLLFIITGTPFLRDGLVFNLPGIAIRVAEECSGIRSSLVLFITSLVAGYMFLESPWRRAVLTAAVIPLGIVRNAIRILTIALLCVHDDPTWINSGLHRHGGPLFFALSLGPFFLFLLWLRKRERRKSEGGERRSEVG